MDTEQIQRQMNSHRAAIDARLALLASRAEDARRTAAPVAVAFIVAAGLMILWRRRRHHRKGPALTA
jgi:hypothetical protein